MKTGVLGGTFNPPHLGHLHAARLAKKALNLDRVLFIPTNIPPHKSLPANTASTEERCEMVRLMIQNEKWAALDRIEIDRGGASYTVDTLRMLHERDPEDELWLIVGTDMLLSFDLTWKEPRIITSLAGLAVCARAEEDWDILERKAAFLRQSLHAKIILARGESLTISSTELRQGEEWEQYVSPAVAVYMTRRNLYGFSSGN